MDAKLMIPLLRIISNCFWCAQEHSKRIHERNAAASAFRMAFQGGDAGVAAPDERAPVGAAFLGKTQILNLMNAKTYLPPNPILFYDQTYNRIRGFYHFRDKRQETFPWLLHDGGARNCHEGSAQLVVVETLAIIS